jgi:cysteine desulfurase/selenocysteine lyase
MSKIAAHSRALAAQMLEGLRGLPNATVLGRSARDRIGLATVSLPWPAMRQQDIARLLADAHAIFVSGGFHCAHVLHRRLQLDGTLRVSAHIYNDAGDVDAFIRALHDL